MKKLLLTALMTSIFQVAPVAIDSASACENCFKKEKGDLMLRLRGIGFIPDESTSNDPAVGGEADASNDYVPELDLTYFLTDKWALEIIAATTKHEMTLKNSVLVNDVDMGDVGVLPPVVTLQYHFDAIDAGNGVRFLPYAGAGINYTIFYNEDAPGPGNTVTDIDYDNSFGYAFQVGVDIPKDDKWFFNLDVKKVFVDTDVTYTVGGTDYNANVDLDPWVFGIGFGYKF